MDGPDRLFIFLAAVIVWSITGSLPTCINTAGVMHGGEAVCYLSTADAGKVKIGQEVELQAAGQNETIKGKVAGIAGIPMSAGEITAELKNDYLTQTLAPKGFAVKINISVNNSDMAEGTLLNLSIVTDAVKPVDFLLK
jgi:hypothetical protein